MSATLPRQSGQQSSVSVEGHVGEGLEEKTESKLETDGGGRHSEKWQFTGGTQHELLGYRQILS